MRAPRSTSRSPCSPRPTTQIHRSHDLELLEAILAIAFLTGGLTATLRSDSAQKILLGVSVAVVERRRRRTGGALVRRRERSGSDAALLVSAGRCWPAAGRARPAAHAEDAGSSAASCAGTIAVMASAGSAGGTQPAQMNWARVALDAFNAEHGSSFTIEPSNVYDETDLAGAEAKRLAADPGRRRSCRTRGVVGHGDRRADLRCRGPRLRLAISDGRLTDRRPPRALLPGRGEQQPASRGHRSTGHIASLHREDRPRRRRPRGLLDQPHQAHREAPLEAPHRASTGPRSTSGRRTSPTSSPRSGRRRTSW